MDEEELRRPAKRWGKYSLDDYLCQEEEEEEYAVDDATCAGDDSNVSY